MDLVVVISVILFVSFTTYLVKFLKFPEETKKVVTGMTKFFMRKWYFILAFYVVFLTRTLANNDLCMLEKILNPAIFIFVILVLFYLHALLNEVPSKIVKK